MSQREVAVALVCFANKKGAATTQRALEERLRSSGNKVLQTTILQVNGKHKASVHDPRRVVAGTLTAALTWGLFGLVAGTNKLESTIIWAVITLISPNRQFTLRALSDAIFWAAALLMLGGLVAPSTSDLQGDKDKNRRRERPKSLEERRERAMERRIKRVYDPWRWRVWGAAALTFGLAILTGFTTMNG